MRGRTTCFLSNSPALLGMYVCTNDKLAFIIIQFMRSACQTNWETWSSELCVFQDTDIDENGIKTVYIADSIGSSAKLLLSLIACFLRPQRGFPNMLLRKNEYLRALTASYTFQSLRVSGLRQSLFVMNYWFSTRRVWITSRFRIQCVIHIVLTSL